MMNNIRLTIEKVIVKRLIHKIEKNIIPITDECSKKDLLFWLENLKDFQNGDHLKVFKMTGKLRVKINDWNNKYS